MPPIFARAFHRPSSSTSSIPSDLLSIHKASRRTSDSNSSTDWANLFRFEKSLYDLIRGLRQNKGNEKAYIQNCLKECRQEVRSTDGDLKATAILKLIYLDMFGYDMSWASFNVLEVMSSGKFQHKRIGYLAAVQSFRLDTEVLMLTTNQIKKVG